MSKELSAFEERLLDALAAGEADPAKLAELCEGKAENVLAAFERDAFKAAISDRVPKVILRHVLPAVTRLCQAAAGEGTTQDRQVFMQLAGLIRKDQRPIINVGEGGTATVYLLSHEALWAKVKAAVGKEFESEVTIDAELVPVIALPAPGDTELSGEIVEANGAGIAPRSGSAAKVKRNAKRGIRKEDKS